MYIVKRILEKVMLYLQSRSSLSTIISQNGWLYYTPCCLLLSFHIPLGSIMVSPSDGFDICRECSNIIGLISHFFRFREIFCIDVDMCDLCVVQFRPFVHVVRSGD